MKALILLFLLTATSYASDIVAATLILEAGGEKDSRAMAAVFEVIANRAQKRKLTLEQVCLQPKQFSCWNGSRKVAIDKAKKHSKFAEAQKIVSSVSNYTNGADHYHTKAVSPSWAKRLTKTVTIGEHIFYK